ncbi:MAG TPA: L-threonine 3-dehydrogenase [Planctomycetes bacterium]|nr:L-threonine 3-dehydrogenase [Planctomycetota bacterium]HIN80989.1 L-threonine 3-dehydrogenase [Planctomycetota bacterium]
MRALCKTGPEPGLHLVEKPIPTIKPDEVLVRVMATSICGTDLHIFNWDAWARSKVVQPLTIGHEFCGEVVEVGAKVMTIETGDFVAAESHVFCGDCYQCKIGNRHICENEEIIGIHRDGAFADFIAMPQRCIWKTSRDIPPEIATLQEPLGNSVHATLIADLSRKDVAVFGCGPTGLFAVAIAKICGASSVVAIDVQPYRLELARKMGADQVANPLETDVPHFIRELTGGHGTDVVLEMSGNPNAVEDGFKCLARGGDFRFFGVPKERLSIDVARDVIFKGARIRGIIGRKIFKTWFEATRLLQGGLDLRPLVTHKFPLEDFGKAFDLIQSGECGKIVMFPSAIDE